MRIKTRSKGDYRVRSFKCWHQFLCMSFGQMTRRESLRDIVTCLQSQQKKLYHIGITKGVSKSTLADENGVQEGIITHYLQGREVPLAYRDDLLKWMVSLQKRFPDYTAFAVADRAALVGDQQAAQAQVYTATTMASGWFEQLEAERFAFHPFPVEAQFAPLNDGLVRDFNQDGQVDILLVGNDFGADTQTGRYDASHGLLLLGNGRNGFQTAQRQEAVVYAPGVYTSIAEITLDDQQVGILIGENGGKLRLFQRLLEGRQLR